jgi:hypothetical protein
LESVKKGSGVKPFPFPLTIYDKLLELKTNYHETENQFIYSRNHLPRCNGNDGNSHQHYLSLNHKQTMRYLIITKEGAPFITRWYTEEFWNPETYSMVIDFHRAHYTTDGKNWNTINYDHL